MPSPPTRMSAFSTRPPLKWTRTPRPHRPGRARPACRSVPRAGAARRPDSRVASPGRARRARRPREVDVGAAAVHDLRRMDRKRGRAVDGHGLSAYGRIGKLTVRGRPSFREARCSSCSSDFRYGADGGRSLAELAKSVPASPSQIRAFGFPALGSYRSAIGLQCRRLQSLTRRHSRSKGRSAGKRVQA